jgi:hypothetical protein
VAKRLIMALLIAAFVAVLVQSLPDIQRYIRIRQMLANWLITGGCCVIRAGASFILVKDASAGTRRIKCTTRNTHNGIHENARAMAGSRQGNALAAMNGRAQTPGLTRALPDAGATGRGRYRTRALVVTSALAAVDVQDLACDERR